MTHDVNRWGRLALVGITGYWTLRLASGAQSWCFLDLVNLAFHEAGHLVMVPFGTTLHYLGGTIGQLAVPALLVVYFIARRDQLFAAALCAWWAGENLINVAVYMADARALTLPLVGGGDHDWNELFYRFGMLGEGAVGTVSSVTHGLGTTLMILGLLWAAYFVLGERVRGAIDDLVDARLPALRFLFDSGGGAGVE